MRAVWKYAIELGGVTKLNLPLGSQPLHCSVDPAVFSWESGCDSGTVVLSTQYDLSANLRLWVEVDTTVKEKKERLFQIIGTGQPIPEGWTYAQTVIVPHFAWHVYEYISQEDREDDGAPFRDY